MNIGQRLREERERLGLSQERFAAVGGVQKRAQINYESGERVPDAHYLEGIALLGVNLLYVVTGTRDAEPPPAVTAEERLLLDYYRDAQPALRKAAVAALLSGHTGGASMNMSNLGNGNVQVGSGARVSVKQSK
jgi:transcriptional regulator with XRE-family HTH domain